MGFSGESGDSNSVVAEELVGWGVVGGSGISKSLLGDSEGLSSEITCSSSSKIEGVDGSSGDVDLDGDPCRGVQ